MNDSQQLAVEWVSIKELSLNPANPRKNDDAVEHVAASLKRFGWQQPVVARPSGEVIAGNTRLKAANTLGITRIPVVRFSGTDLEATAYGIADNRTHEFSDWDESALADLLKILKEEDALEGIGFGADDIETLLRQLDEEDAEARDLDDPGPLEPPVEPITKPGDLWVMGDHKLLCGDATNPDHVARLMGNDQAVLLSTDPPYAVEYTGDDRPGGGKDWSSKYQEVPLKDFEEFLRRLLATALPHLAPNAAFYFWHAHLQYPALDRVLEEFQILRHQQLIWLKPTPTITRSSYRWAHEPCVFGWQKGHKPPHYGNNEYTTLWDAHWEGKLRVSGNDHPTQKPVKLFEIPMEQHTRAGEVIFEPFCGSGSQLIAAEKLGRTCRAMEISPAFVDAAVRRWERATGIKASRR